MSVIKRKNNEGQWEFVEVVANDTRIGDMSTLATSEKTSVVSSINELNTQLAQIAINIKQLGFGIVGDGLTDDTAAFRNLASYVQTNKPSRIIIPKGDYVINLNNSEVLFNLTDFPKLEIIAPGVTFKSTRSFAEGETAIIFKFTNCKNVTSKDIKLTGLVTDFATQTTKKGYTLYNFFNGNDGINIDGEILDHFAFIIFGDGPSTSPKPQNKNGFIKGRVYRTEYGLVCANSGDNIEANLYGELNHRLYYPYGVRKHRVHLFSRSPRTVTAKLAAYQYDTTDIHLDVTIVYTDDTESRGKLNGGVELNTNDELALTDGKISGIRLKIHAKDESSTGNNYRPILSFGANYTGDGIIENVEVDMVVESWTGNGTYRPVIGLAEVTGYNADLTPIFSANFFEPNLKNIVFKNLSLYSMFQSKVMEFSMSKLKGNFIVENLECNGTANVRNIGTDGTANVRFMNVNARTLTGQSFPAQMDMSFMAKSKNHSFGRLKEESATLAQPKVSLLQFDVPKMVSGNAAGATTFDISPIHVPDNTNYAKLDFKGLATGIVFEGTIELRTDGTGGFTSNTKVVRFSSYNISNGSADSSTTVTAVIDVDKSLILRFTNPTSGNLNFMSIQSKIRTI